MPKNPNGGPSGPPETASPGADGDTPAGAGERRTATRAGSGEPRTPPLPAEPRPDGGASPAPSAGDATAPAAGGEAAPAAAARGRIVADRKKQYLIAPRQPADSMGMLSFAPLQLSSIEQSLRASPDIEIVDTVGPKSTMGMLADGMGAAQGVLVARMSEQKAGALHQQGQGRLLVERDQPLNLMEAALLQPGFVTSVATAGAPTFTAVINVVDRDGAPVADAEVSLFGSMLPASAVTDASGQASLALYGDTAQSVRGLYVKPKADHWSFYHRDPDLSADEPNVVALRPLSDWPGLAGFPRQKCYGWGQKAMRLDQLPGNYRGQDIKIAVIDSGVATTHEGLNRIRAGFDIVNKKTSPDTWNEDTLGHGSHCAGVIGATDLAFGVRGFAPEAEIHVCKLFPGGQVSQLIDALEYCIDRQIDVVNLSLGGAEVSEALEQQIIRAKRAGVACIVAAGNSGGPVQYPASSPNVLAVAAVGKIDEFPPDSYHAQTLSANVDANGYFSASFSCFGPQVGVCGPGVAITSTVPPNNYAAWDGTSMAAPHISGLAALVLAHHPEFQGLYKVRSADRVERLFQVIRMSARRVSLADPSRVGMGLPDAVVAVGLQASPHAQAGAGAQQAIGSLMGSSLGQAGPGQALMTQSATGPLMPAQAGFGAQPGLAQSAFGQGGLAQAGSGQSGFGQGGAGQAGFGQSGFGQAGFGQAGVGQSGFGQAPLRPQFDPYAFESALAAYQAYLPALFAPTPNLPSIGAGLPFGPGPAFGFGRGFW